MKLSVKSVSQLVGSKWLVLATFFCQSLVLCIYIGLSDETTWKRVKLCILQLKSPFTSWKGNPRRILTLREAGFVRDFSRGKLELSGPAPGLGYHSCSLIVQGNEIQSSFVAFGCSLHLCVLLPWKEKRHFQNKGCLCKAPWENVWMCLFLKWQFVSIAFLLLLLFLCGIRNNTIHLTP